MLRTNHLTLDIQDTTDESSLSVELSSETMYKLYRIKEINNYHSFFEYDDYDKFCTEIQNALKKFIQSINQEYLETMDTEFFDANDIDKRLIDDAELFIKHMDHLIANGYTYKEALTIVNERFLK